MVDKQQNWSFNLWNQPWIGVEMMNGTSGVLSIADVLKSARDIRFIHEQSPLVVASIHRLLVAIIQDIFNPQNHQDIEGIIKQGKFSEAEVGRFGGLYAARFDLFSEDEPFLQSADLPIIPQKAEPQKTVAYLLHDIPAGTNIVHFKHVLDDNQSFCPVCCAKGLVTVPVFSTTGGAGIKPSINGVPPLYVIPGGETLFHSLAFSLLEKAFQPAIGSSEANDVWWKRKPVVKRSSEVMKVSYLASLLFPARRIRLHPSVDNAVCTYCGMQSAVVVKTMVFEMGEMLPKEFPPWFDPFAAYRIPKKEGSSPIPIRPSAGKAVWREFSTLFLSSRDKQKSTDGDKYLRPRVLDQISVLFQDDTDGENTASHLNGFRCIGMRTDMKAKIFEWVDSQFYFPIKLIKDSDLAMIEVDRAIKIAEIVDFELNQAFRIAFAGGSKGIEKFAVIRQRMKDQYWTNLAIAFSHFVHTLDPWQPDQAREEWLDVVLKQAKSSLQWALKVLPDDARSLAKKVEAESRFGFSMKKLLDKEGNNG